MIQNHLYSGAQRQILSGGKSMPTRRCVVLHFTNGATAQSSINFWKEPAQRANDIGAHIIIDRNGTVIQCRAFNLTISHAGTSRWVDPNTGVKHTSCNKFAIGIELANAGDDPEVIKIAKGLEGYAGTVKLKHRNGGGVKSWEVFPKAQVDACAALVKDLVAFYNLDDVTSHDCIAPERKNDVGPAYPIEALRMEVGMSGLPVVHWP